MLQSMTLDFVNNCCLTVRVWVRMARMEMDCNLKTVATVFKLFPRAFKESIFIAEV